MLDIFIDIFTGCKSKTAMNKSLVVGYSTVYGGGEGNTIMGTMTACLFLSERLSKIFWLSLSDGQCPALQNFSVHVTAQVTVSILVGLKGFFLARPLMALVAVFCLYLNPCSFPFRHRSSWHLPVSLSDRWGVMNAMSRSHSYPNFHPLADG